MSWGWKIAILYGTFITGIMFLVFKSSQRKVELVRPDYYQQELLYGQRISAIEATEALSGPITSKVSEGKVHIVFPAECGSSDLAGKIKLYRPDDSSADQDFPISLDENSEQIIEPLNPKVGYYILQYTWQMDSKDYYHEQSIYMQP